MGAVGASILAKEEVQKKGYTSFVGFDMINHEYKAKSFECTGCPNICEIVEILSDGKTMARWGDRCGKWSNIAVESKESGVKEKIMEKVEEKASSKILVG
jgi:hypothetical protein